MLSSLWKRENVLSFLALIEEHSGPAAKPGSLFERRLLLSRRLFVPLHLWESCLMERSENKRHLSSTDAEGKREARRFQIDGDGERWLGENRKIEKLIERCTRRVSEAKQPNLEGKTARNGAREVCVASANTVGKWEVWPYITASSTWRIWETARGHRCAILQNTHPRRHLRPRPPRISLVESLVS